MMSANVGCADWASELDTATMVPTKMADVDSASKTCAAAQERARERGRARAEWAFVCVGGGHSPASTAQRTGWRAPRPHLRDVCSRTHRERLREEHGGEQRVEDERGRAQRRLLAEVEHGVRGQVQQRAHNHQAEPPPPDPARARRGGRLRGAGGRMEGRGGELARGGGSNSGADARAHECAGCAMPANSPTSLRQARRLTRRRRPRARRQPCHRRRSCRRPPAPARASAPSSAARTRARPETCSRSGC